DLALEEVDRVVPVPPAPGRAVRGAVPRVVEREDEPGQAGARWRRGAGGERSRQRQWLVGGRDGLGRPPETGVPPERAVTVEAPDPGADEGGDETEAEEAGQAARAAALTGRGEGSGGARARPAPARRTVRGAGDRAREGSGPWSGRTPRGR